MASAKLSDKQLEIFEYIQSFTRERGFPPSVREIGEAVGLRSPSTVHAHLKTLDRAGYITRDGHKMRAIRMAGSEQAEEKWRSIPVNRVQNPIFSTFSVQKISVWPMGSLSKVKQTLPTTCP